ncbi:hypothetical protein ACYRFS_02435 [Listeria kieliensis]
MSKQTLEKKEQEIVYPELTEHQEQAMINFFSTRSFPRIIKKLEEQEKKEKRDKHV